ncbi:MAG: WcaI family glycosyltransferase [Gammaproteobacteria bacterium]
MRVLIVAINFAPELTGIGKYVGDMTAWMTEAGIDVRVVTAPPYYPEWSVRKGYSGRRYTTEQLCGAKVIRCPLWVPRRPGGLTRVLHLISFAISSFPVVLWQALTWRPETVMVIEPPLSCAPTAWLAARLCGARAWLHVQDLEVDAAFNLGMLRRPWLRKLVLATERALMRRFDRVTSISQRMLARLREKGVTDEQLGFFPNWVDTDVIRPINGSSTLRAALGITGDTPVLLYSGNMGEKQGLEVIVEVARLFDASAEKGLFMLCGDGAARARIERAADGLTNVRFIPLQPVERLNELLNLADIHLLPQREDTEGLVMPSKLTAIMASGKPVVAEPTATRMWGAPPRRAASWCLPGMPARSRVRSASCWPTRRCAKSWESQVAITPWRTGKRAPSCVARSPISRRASR